MYCSGVATTKTIQLNSRKSMATPLRALVIEDSENDFILLLSILQTGGYDVAHQRVDTAVGLKSTLGDPWDIIISDFSMPGFRGTDALAIVRERDPDVPFIFLSGTIGEEMAVNAMKAGAQDYVLKGNVARLLPAIERELREAGARREKKQVEHRVRQLEKFEALGKLAGGVAHDFNNVIGAIMGWAEIGADRVADGSQEGKLFRKIGDQARRAAGLTRQLLAYARRQILEPKNVNLNQMVKETTALLEKVIGEQIEVKMALAEDLRITRADPAQIEQVLMNLCFNARDAMPSGGQLLIETRNLDLDEKYCSRHADARPGRWVQLSVSDSGTGMDAATLERIYEPFFTTKEVGKGTGLGLATVFGIMKQHGGFIEVYSEVGTGTAFHVHLPVVEAAADSLRAADDTPARGGNELILVAEDHDGMRDMAEQILGTLGYRLILVHDGDEAVRKFREHLDEVSLLLMDVVMPKMAGTEAYEKISADRPGIPVIFTSGYSEQGAYLASALRAGATVLQKPYGARSLARKVRELLDGVAAAKHSHEVVS
jgi:two-component system, cell cycle sensor histidine kinase and response regulator CckA